jgi:SAM-dependent methyltransferase
MDRYEKETYGEVWAADYDRFAPGVAKGMIDRLEDLAANGRVLELAIGTGRVAIPLASRGIEVIGIDISEAMLSRLREKPGGNDLKVVMGDFAEVAIEGRFSLIYVVANTFFVLLDQEDQVRCFANVARHLEPGGRFLIEAFVPDLARFDRGQRVQVHQIDLDRVRLDVSQHDLAEQQIRSQHVEITTGHVKLLPVSIRYAWPSELDLMARLAGLELEERWGGWRMEPFTSESAKHVSVYKVAGP